MPWYLTLIGSRDDVIYQFHQMLIRENWFPCLPKFSILYPTVYLEQSQWNCCTARALRRCYTFFPLFCPQFIMSEFMTGGEKGVLSLVQAIISFFRLQFLRGKNHVKYQFHQILRTSIAKIPLYKCKPIVLRLLSFLIVEMHLQYLKKNFKDIFPGLIKYLVFNMI